MHLLYSDTCRLREIEFYTAIRGFHFDKKYWKRKVKKFCQVLINLEIPSTFLLSKHIKTMELLLAICHVKYLKQRSFSWTKEQWSCKMSSVHYWKYLLIQGGMEISCKVFVRMRPTIKKNEILERFLNLVKSNYLEPEFLGIPR